MCHRSFSACLCATPSSFDESLSVSIGDYIGVFLVSSFGSSLCVSLAASGGVSIGGSLGVQPAFPSPSLSRNTSACLPASSSASPLACVSPGPSAVPSACLSFSFPACLSAGASACLSTSHSPYRSKVHSACPSAIQSTGSSTTPSASLYGFLCKALGVRPGVSLGVSQCLLRCVSQRSLRRLPCHSLGGSLDVFLGGGPLCVSRAFPRRFSQRSPLLVPSAGSSGLLRPVSR